MKKCILNGGTNFNKGDRKMNRRNFIKVGSMGVAAFLLSGCGVRNSSSVVCAGVYSFCGFWTNYEDYSYYRKST